MVCLIWDGLTPVVGELGTALEVLERRGDTGPNWVSENSWNVLAGAGMYCTTGCMFQLATW